MTDASNPRGQPISNMPGCRSLRCPAGRCQTLDVGRRPLQPDFDNHGVIIGVAIQPGVRRDCGSGLFERITNDERFRVDLCGSGAGNLPADNVLFGEVLSD